MPARVAVDTGPLVALIDKCDANHESARRFLQTTRAELFTNLAVIAEASHLLSFSLQAQLNLLGLVRSDTVRLIHPLSEDLDRVDQLMRKYADRPMDFADALLVATCERLNVRQIASVDLDFSIYRFRNRGRFENVLFEGASG